MIWTLVYCAFFVVIGFLVTRWSDQKAKDRVVWLEYESMLAFWMTIVVFFMCIFVDPIISQAVASLFAGYIVRLYWVFVQLDGENDDGIETE